MEAPFPPPGMHFMPSGLLYVEGSPMRGFVPRILCCHRESKSSGLFSYSALMTPPFPPPRISFDL